MKNQILQVFVRIFGGFVFVSCIFLVLLALHKYSDVISGYMDVGLGNLFKPLDNAPLWAIIFLIMVTLILFLASIMFYALVVSSAQTGIRITTLMKSLREMFNANKQ